MRPQIGESLRVSGCVARLTEAVQGMVDDSASDALCGVLGISITPGTQRGVTKRPPCRISGIHPPAGHVPTGDGDLIRDVVGDVVVKGRRRDVARQTASHSPENPLRGAVSEDRTRPPCAQTDRRDPLERPSCPIRQSQSLVEPPVKFGGCTISPSLGRHDLTQHRQGIARHARAHVRRHRGEGLSRVEEHGDQLRINGGRRTGSGDETADVQGHRRS